MIKIIRILLAVTFVVGVGSLAAAGKATYYEEFKGSNSVQFTEVDFVDLDAGETLPEDKSVTYILKNEETYSLVMHLKHGVLVLGLAFSKKYKDVFKITSYEFSATPPPAGSPASSSSRR